MHACYLFIIIIIIIIIYFLINHPSSHLFIRRQSLYHLSTFLSNLPAGHVKKEAVARYTDIIQIDLPTVIFSYPK